MSRNSSTRASAPCRRRPRPRAREGIQPPSDCRSDRATPRARAHDSYPYPSTDIPAAPQGRTRDGWRLGRGRPCSSVYVGTPAYLAVSSLWKYAGDFMCHFICTGAPASLDSTLDARFASSPWPHARPAPSAISRTRPSRACTTARATRPAGAPRVVWCVQLAAACPQAAAVCLLGVLVW